MNDVQVPVQWFGVDDLNRYQFAVTEFVSDSDLWQEPQSKLALDHSLAGFDGFDLKHHVRQQTCAPK